VIVDYLQLISARGNSANRNEEVSSIHARTEEHGEGIESPRVGSFAAHAAPRKREDRRPQLSDLRESGAIEQDADVVMSSTAERVQT